MLNPRNDPRPQDIASRSTTTHDSQSRPISPDGAGQHYSSSPTRIPVHSSRLQMLSNTTQPTGGKDRSRTRKTVGPVHGSLTTSMLRPARPASPYSNPAQRYQPGPRIRLRVVEDGRSLSFVSDRGRQQIDLASPPDFPASFGQAQNRLYRSDRNQLISSRPMDSEGDTATRASTIERAEPKRRIPSRSAASPRPDPPRAFTSPVLPSSKELSNAYPGTSEESASSSLQTPKRGRTRTVAPVIGRGWQIQDSLPVASPLRALSPGIQPGALNLAVLDTENLGVGLGGHKLGVRQPERQVLTPCASPPKRSIHAMVLPIPIGSGAAVKRNQDVPRRRSASPRDSAAGTSVQASGSILSGARSLDAVEDVFDSKPILVSPATYGPSRSQNRDDDHDHDIDVEAIEAALSDAMETSLELPDIQDDNGPDANQYDTIRSSGKRKNQEEPAMYPEKKGKVADLVARYEEPAAIKARPSIFNRAKTADERYRRPMSMIIQDSACTIALSADVQASAELTPSRTPKWSRAQTMRADVCLHKRPSIDNLIKGLQPIDNASLAATEAWKPLGRLPRRGTMPSVIQALDRKDPADQKARPSLVKQVTEVILTPIGNTAAPDGDEPGATATRMTETEALRTASISLKRIQDDDLERSMHAYQTRSRSHSPASHLEAAYRASEAAATTASNGLSWDTLHRQNVMERARHVGNEWFRSRNRAGTLGSVWPNASKDLPPGTTPPITRPGLLNRSVSYTGKSTQRSGRDSSPTASTDRRPSGGETTLMHTRWDGTKTPITERDHPTHYAALQEHRLVRQKSKQNLPLKRTPDSTSDHRSSGKDQDVPAVGLASILPPVSIERWRQQLHQAGGRTLPQVKSTGQRSPREGSRPVYRHARTLPLPLDTSNLSRSPTLSRSNTSQDSHIPLSACSGASFDVKTAYDRVKTERGLVSFDQIPGLNDAD